MNTKDIQISQIQLGFFDEIEEETGGYGFGTEGSFPVYEEIESSDELRNIDKVALDIESIDWACTKEHTGFLTHDLHPYPAKFIPQIPGHIIARLSLRGELVFDPFGGSGTTALEAVRLGRRALSIDANPIGTLIGTVKTSNLDRIAAMDLRAIRSSLKTRLNNIDESDSIYEENKEYIPEIPNMDKWFPLTSRSEMALIRSRIAASH